MNINTKPLNMKARSNKALFILCYYAFLLLAYVLLSRPEIEYSLSFRLLFFAATLMPAIKNTTYFTTSIVCFYSMTYIAFTPILPTSLIYYIPIVLLYYIIHFKSSRNITYQIFFLLYYFSICMYYEDYDTFLSSFLIAIIISSFINKDWQLDYIASALMVSSIILSILFYTNMDYYVYAYGSSHDQDRYGWINPNEYAGAVGCGGVVAMQYLFSNIQTHRSWLKLLSYITLFVSAIIVVINASRGAAISFGGVLLLFILLSRNRNRYKLISSVFILGVFYFIAQNDYSTFLLSRFEDSSLYTWSGRLVIWKTKLDTFVGDSNILEFLFGVGRVGSIKIPPVISTHNDFLTAFIGFGLVGVILLCIILLFPILKASKTNKLPIILMTLYLVLECNVLEPLFRGYFTFVIFFFYIYKNAIIRKASINE